MKVHCWGTCLFRSWRHRATALCCVAALLAGCQAVVSPTPSPSPTPTPDTESEPNGSFTTARIVSLAVDDSVVLSGAIDGVGDVDVFNLGSASTGDEIRLSLRRQSSELRSALGLYDIEGELIAEDTLASVNEPSADPEIIHVVRQDSASIFAAVTHNIARSTTGEYEIDLTITRGGMPPAPQRQFVLLNFNGGEVNDPLLGEITVGPFDAADIAAVYVGQTEVIRSGIVATILKNYAGLDIEFVQNAADLPADVQHSEIVFGGFSILAFGAAEQIDPYNADPTDKAIIFTGAFEPGLFPFTPSADSLGVAIGNVAAHELGHLLGLNHVNDATALMDEASPAYTLLEDQIFKSAPLSPSIFPLGLHDSADLLLVTLGASADSIALSAKRSLPITTISTRQPAVNTSRGKCLNCMIREGRAGRGPLGKTLGYPAANQ